MLGISLRDRLRNADGTHRGSHVDEITPRHNGAKGKS